MAERSSGDPFAPRILNPGPACSSPPRRNALSDSVGSGECWRLMPFIGVCAVIVLVGGRVDWVGAGMSAGSGGG